MSLKLSLLLFMFSLPCFAKNYITLMGGGGEPKGDKTIFDFEIKNVAGFLQKSNWEAKVAYNGGHKNTEQILAPLKTRTHVENFTTKAYDKIIKDYIEKIKSGKITKSDQLILYISSHGAGAKKGEKTHSISTSGNKVLDFNTLAGSTMVSLDKLSELSQLANQKGIKLGIIDMSCHSGSSLPLANNNTCVITSTGPNHFAWGGNNFTFASQFSKNMAKGRSLEEIFIKANSEKRDVSFPMISSNTGKRIQNEIYQEISPYLYDSRDKLSKDKMYTYYENQYSTNKCEILDDNYIKLKNFVQGMNRVVASSQLSKLRSHIEDYYDLQKEIKASLNLKNSYPYNKEKKLCSANGRECTTYTLFNILQMDTVKARTLLEGQMRSSRGNDQIKLAQKLDILNAVHNLKIGHLSNNPFYANIFNRHSQEKIKTETSKLSRAIAGELQKIYPQIYAQYKKSAPVQNNPCASIKL